MSKSKPITLLDGINDKLEYSYHTGREANSIRLYETRNYLHVIMRPMSGNITMIVYKKPTNKKSKDFTNEQQLVIKAARGITIYPRIICTNEFSKVLDIIEDILIDESDMPPMSVDKDGFIVLCSTNYDKKPSSIVNRMKTMMTQFARSRYIHVFAPNRAPSQLMRVREDDVTSDLINSVVSFILLQGHNYDVNWGTNDTALVKQKFTFSPGRKRADTVATREGFKLIDQIKDILENLGVTECTEDLAKIMAHHLVMRTFKFNPNVVIDTDYDD